MARSPMFPERFVRIGAWRASDRSEGVKIPQMACSDFSAKRATKRQSSIDVSSIALPKLLLRYAVKTDGEYERGQ
jgi:hypothetical protein